MRLHCLCLQCCAFGALTLLVGRQEEHPVRINWLMMCWCGYLSATRFRLFACGPADATAVPKPHHLLPRLNPDWFYLSGTGIESVPIQLAQCWFPGLAISNAKIWIYFSKNILKQFCQTALESCHGLKLPKCKFSHRRGNSATAGAARWPSAGDTVGCRLRRPTLTPVSFISMSLSHRASTYVSYGMVWYGMVWYNGMVNVDLYSAILSPMRWTR